VQRTVAQLPWRSNLTLLDKRNDEKTRIWYAQKALEQGTGKDMLAIQIETRLHEREGKAVNNFPATLPPLLPKPAPDGFCDMINIVLTLAVCDSTNSNSSVSCASIERACRSSTSDDFRA